MEAFGWAVIGTGGIALRVMKEVTATKKHKVIACYSRTKERAQKFAEKFGAKVFDTLKEAVKFEGVQGVYIATPHSVHYKNALECLELGVPVLCEKSFTVNASQAKELFKLANEKKVYISEAMWTRFNPITKQVRKWVEDKEIGDIKSLKCSFAVNMELSKPFLSERVYTKEYAGGSLLDLGVYTVSYAEMLFGRPDSIKCKMEISPKYDVDVNDEITLNYENGCACQLLSSLNQFTMTSAEITGTKGKIKLPFLFYKPNKVILEKEREKKVVKDKRGYIYQFDKVAQDILSGKLMSEEIPWSDTIDVMSIMDECRKQNGFYYSELLENM